MSRVSVVLASLLALVSVLLLVSVVRGCGDGKDGKQAAVSSGSDLPVCKGFERGKDCRFVLSLPPCGPGYKREDDCIDTTLAKNNLLRYPYWRRSAKKWRDSVENFEKSLSSVQRDSLAAVHDSLATFYKANPELIRRMLDSVNFEGSFKPSFHSNEFPYDMYRKVGGNEKALDSALDAIENLPPESRKLLKDNKKRLDSLHLYYRKNYKEWFK